MKNKKVALIILIGIIVSEILLMYKSFALFSQNQISKSVITIKAGTLTPILKVDNVVQNSLVVAKNETKTFSVTIENQENISGKFLLYYLGTLSSDVTFGYLEESGVSIPIKEGVVLANKEKQTYSLYVSNQSSDAVTINLQTLGGLSNQSLLLPSGGNYIEKTTKKIIYSNPLMSNILKYDETVGSSTFCVTGEESTCLQIETPETFEAGTIIKYKVNDTLELYFHVMFDNGTTLTMQQRENIVHRTRWYATDSSNEGPLTILPALESATSGWTNVNTQQYSLGKTWFRPNLNPYTGCSYSYSTNQYTCNVNRYTLGVRTAKARMISVQEALQFGCAHAVKTCPVWMRNYLHNSIQYGGTVEVTGSPYGLNSSYWTSSAVSDESGKAWVIYGSGYLGNTSVDLNTLQVGARAVVVINK